MDLSHEELKRSILSLLKLQEIDAQLFKLNEEIETPPQDFLESKAKIQEAENLVKTAERSFRQLDRERRALELKYLTLQEDLRKADTRRKEVRNTKEEFSSGKEVEGFQRRIIETKKLLDERAQQAEQRSAVLEEKKASFAKLNETYTEKLAARDQSLEVLKAEREKLQENRKEHISQVDEEVFSMYERVQKLRRGSGIAIVKGGVCGGCFVALPPQMVSKLQKLDALTTCSSCSRILFPESHLDGEELPAQRSNAL